MLAATALVREAHFFEFYTDAPFELAANDGSEAVTVTL
jgi:hypothetical protein